MHLISINVVNSLILCVHSSPFLLRSFNEFIDVYHTIHKCVCIHAHGLLPAPYPRLIIAFTAVYIRFELVYYHHFRAMSRWSLHRLHCVWFMTPLHLKRTYSHFNYNLFDNIGFVIGKPILSCILWRANLTEIFSQTVEKQ